MYKPSITPNNYNDAGFMLMDDDLRALSRHTLWESRVYGERKANCTEGQQLIDIMI